MSGTFTICTYPLVAALKAADHFLKRIEWTPKNKIQREFLNLFWEPCHTEIEDIQEIKAIAHTEFHIINQFLRDHGFDIQLTSWPDPNGFGGPVRIRRAGAGEWSTVPLSHGYAENGRGIGVADMAYALRSGRPHRANGELAYHVLDIMEAFHDASRESRHIELTSTCTRPASLPLGLIPGKLDE